MKWTPEDEKRLRKHTTAWNAAKALKRSITAVRNKAKIIGHVFVADEAKAQAAISPLKSVTTVKEDLKAHNEHFWKEQYHTLSDKYDRLAKEQTVTERLVENIRAMAPVSYAPLSPLHEPIRNSKLTPQSAVLMFSDTHIGKEVKSSQTLTFGSYNFDMFKARLKTLEDSVKSIVKNHTLTPVSELVIAMLGDMLDGTLSHSNEAGQPDPIFNQFYAGAHVIAQFFRNLAPHFPVVRIYDVVGNHTRFQNQKRMPTKNRYSNFDNFLYALVRELVRDIKNIEWELDTQPYEIFEVNGFTFFAAHGDTLRGGDKALGVPNHAVGRLVSTATQLMNKYQKKAPNYYLLGHLHREISLPHATGSILVNGGFPGVDEYGLAEMFTPADPSQKFFMVHEIYGKTATYDINLKFAKPDDVVEHYAVPEGFSMT